MKLNSNFLKTSVSFSLLISLCSAIVILIGIIGDSGWFLQNNFNVDVDSDQPEIAVRPIRIVIDPGHGGEDGGALAGGIKEKDINLEMSLTLAEIFRLFGYEVSLTRHEDKLLYDLYGDLDDYSGVKKAYDLRNRIRFSKEANADLLISIHMNVYPSPAVCGLQVYYSPDFAFAKNAGEKIQGYTALYLQKYNDRVVKSGNTMYLLKYAALPSVLIECGFMTNSEEIQMLSQADYQRKLAICILTATTAAFAE